MAGWKVFLVSCVMRVGIVSVFGDCDDPPRSEKAVVDTNLNAFPVNIILTYSCRPGYIWDRSSNKKVVCQENSTWTELKITCTPKSCGSLPDVPHGSIQYSDDVVFGSVALITCDEGYNIVGRNQRVCLADGWDHQNPECEPVKCDAPPEVVDGTFELGSSSQDIPVGTVATYKCKTFQLIGNPIIHCTNSGKWSDSPPVCKDVKCPDPQVANGVKKSNFGPTYRYLDSTVFECRSGFWMNGSSTITCKEDNNWDPKPPTCERVCGDPPRSQKAVVNNNLNVFPVNTILTYSCLPGYIWDRSSSNQTICQENSRWTELRITCTPKSCGPLPDVLHGSVEYSDGVVFGSVARISCDEGYNMVGKNQRVCSVDGWDRQSPVCEPVVCDAPPEIVDGTVDWGSTSRDIPVGTVATYRCKKFQLIGNAAIYCTKSGSWSNSPPVCKDVNCPDPQVANGRKTSNFGPNYHYLHFTEFECLSGYGMNGSSTITCKEDNTWHPSPPTCDHTDTSKDETHSAGVFGYVLGAIIALCAVGVAVAAGYHYKKKNGGSNKATEEKMSPAPSVNTSSQQYSALQNKDTNV